MLTGAVRVLELSGVLFILTGCEGIEDFMLAPGLPADDAGIAKSDGGQEDVSTEQSPPDDAGLEPNADITAASEEPKTFAPTKCQTADNLIRNCDFSSELLPWILGTSGNAKATCTINDGSLTVNVTTPATDPWGIQPYQEEITLKPGNVYELRLDAWASRPQPIEIYVSHNASPWTKYHQLTAELGPSQKTFSGIPFRVDREDSNVKVEIWLGSAQTGDQVFIDNVYLGPSTRATAQPSPAQRDVPQGAFMNQVCEKFGVTSVRGGEYAIHNGVWGASTPQCTTVWETPSECGFSVEAAHDQSGPAPSAYPMIRKGWHWGDWTKNSGLPKQVNALASARTVWTYRVPTSGRYNVSYDLWLNPNSNPPTPTGGVELMIWTTRHSAWPAGTRQGTISLEGQTWEVYKGPMSDWTYIAYVSTSNLGSVNFDLKEFLVHAKSNGWVGGDWSLLSVEAGFEIWQGGRFDVDSFSALIQ